MKRRRKNAPRAPNFNVHIHAQAAVYKTGRFFRNDSHSAGANAPNFEIGARGLGPLQPALQMGVFFENHGLDHCRKTDQLNWSTHVIQLVKKKGSKYTLKGYRPITLRNSSSKRCTRLA